MRELVEWYRDFLRAQYAAPVSRGQGFLLGTPLWGRSYIDNFAKYCLPSLCEPKNLEALRGSRMVIFTKESDQNEIISMLHPLGAYGISVEVYPIPMTVVWFVNSSKWNNFLLLGTAQSLCVAMAGRSGHGFHLFAPDHVFCEGYFAHLKRIAEDHDAVMQMSVSVSIETAAAALEEYRKDDGELVIPDRALGTIGLNHLHPQMQNLLMNTCHIPDDLPSAHYLLFKMRDRLRIHTCHHNVAWASPAVCQRFRPRSLTEITSPMDTRLPLLFHGTSPYVVGVDDGMSFVELSDATKEKGERCDALHFAADCWRRVGYGDSYRPYFLQACEVPIDEQPDGFTAEQVDEQMAQIVDILDTNKERAGVLTLQAMYQGRLSFPLQALRA